MICKSETAVGDAQIAIESNGLRFADLVVQTEPVINFNYLNSLTKEATGDIKILNNPNFLASHDDKKSTKWAFYVS